MEIKIIAFNILKGFYYKDKKGLYKHDLKRQEIAKKVIENENPDILILTEANFIKTKPPRKPCQDYKKIFNYRYGIFGCDANKENDWGVGILSRYPIIESHDYTTKHSRFVRAFIKIKNKRLMVDGVHPDPYHNEYQRMQWFKTVIRDRKLPYVIGGDFNAFSKSDNYDKKRLIKAFRNNFKPEDKYKAKEIVEQILTGKTISFLLKEKLIDTFKKKNRKWDYSYHTPLIGTNPDYSRIDYIFCSKDIRVLESGIIKNQLTDKASDHYPIYAILKI